MITKTPGLGYSCFGFDLDWIGIGGYPDIEANVCTKENNKIPDVYVKNH
jgi:hypothetical protein